MDMPSVLKLSKEDACILLKQDFAEKNLKSRIDLAMGGKYVKIAPELATQSEIIQSLCKDVKISKLYETAECPIIGFKQVYALKADNPHNISKSLEKIANSMGLSKKRQLEWKKSESGIGGRAVIQYYDPENEHISVYQDLYATSGNYVEIFTESTDKTLKNIAKAAKIFKTDNIDFQSNQCIDARDMYKFGGNLKNIVSEISLLK